MFRPVQIIFRVCSKLKDVFGAGVLLLLCCGILIIRAVTFLVFILRGIHNIYAPWYS
jgi:hypothetical protein